MQRLVAQGMTLTVCPLSNLKLCVVHDLKDHPMKRMLELGLKATCNSDDPAYFGGYVNDNYVQLFEALGLEGRHAYQLAFNSFEASFADPAQKKAWEHGLKAFFEGLREHD